MNSRESGAQEPRGGNYYYGGYGPRYCGRQQGEPYYGNGPCRQNSWHDFPESAGPRDGAGAGAGGYGYGYRQGRGRGFGNGWDSPEPAQDSTYGTGQRDPNTCQVQKSSVDG